MAKKVLAVAMVDIPILSLKPESSVAASVH